MEKAAILTAFLLLLKQPYFNTAVPFTSPRQEDKNVTQKFTDGSSQNETESYVNCTQLNNYVEQFYTTLSILKESNCTADFLGQSVSQHLCSSNLIHFKYLLDFDATPEEYSYELCFDSVAEGVGEKLGYDIILYKHPSLQENTSAALEVFITENVEVIVGFKWEQLLSYRRIESEVVGWQVFHLDTRISKSHGAQRFCANLQARVQQNSTYLLLNRTSIQEVFFLQPNGPCDLDKQPISALYIFKPPSESSYPPFFPSQEGDHFPFFK